MMICILLFFVHATCAVAWQGRALRLRIMQVGSPPWLLDRDAQHNLRYLAINPGEAGKTYGKEMSLNITESIKDDLKEKEVFKVPLLFWCAIFGMVSCLISCCCCLTTNRRQRGGRRSNKSNVKSRDERQDESDKKAPTGSANPTHPTSPEQDSVNTPPWFKWSSVRAH